jgi:hypothetical protein
VIGAEALVGHHQMHQLAELQVAVDADGGDALARVQREADVGRHVLEPGLVGARRREVCAVLSPICVLGSKLPLS